MKVFKISVKFEQNGKWSNREADTEGYLVKSSDTDDTIIGYVKALYPTNYDSVRFIKGLYSKEGSLVFIQMSNNSVLSPICYCFSDVKKEGFWSEYGRSFGFFPVYPGVACSAGRAKVSLGEITDANQNEKEQKTTAIFEANSSKAIWVNQCLMKDYRALTDFLDSGNIFQMQLHCGKW